MMDSTLETFVPVARDITVGGQSFAILPLKMRQLPGFYHAVQPFVPLLMELRYAEIIMDHAAGARDAVSIATGATAAFLDGLYPDEFLELAGAVFEANLDFFARRVLPKVRASAALVRALVAASPGAHASPISPAGATASPPASG